jgi:hypothetical protein
MGEGQWRVDEEAGRRLTELDEQVARAVRVGDEDARRRGLRELADVVRESGSPLADDDLSPPTRSCPPRTCRSRRRRSCSPVKG